MTKATIEALFGLGIGQPRCPISPYPGEVLSLIRKDFEEAGFYE